NRRCFRGGLGCLLASKWVRFGFVFRHISLILLRISASFCRIFVAARRSMAPIRLPVVVPLLCNVKSGHCQVGLLFVPSSRGEQGAARLCAKYGSRSTGRPRFSRYAKRRRRFRAPATC